MGARVRGVLSQSAPLCLEGQSRNGKNAFAQLIRIRGARARRIGLACRRRRANAASAVAPAAPAIVYKSLREGTGASPTAADTVKVHYRGTLLDGTEFDSSYARNEPATFPLGRVIPCWTEGVQRMKVGGKAELVCPPELAYGERGAGGTIPPNATLRFEIELLAINPR